MASEREDARALWERAQVEAIAALVQLAEADGRRGPMEIGGRELVGMLRRAARRRRKAKRRTTTRRQS